MTGDYATSRDGYTAITGTCMRIHVSRPLASLNLSLWPIASLLGGAILILLGDSPYATCPWPSWPSITESWVKFAVER